MALFIVLSLSYVFIANKKVIILKKIKEEIRLFWGQAKTLLPVDYYWIIFITIIACFLNVVPFILFSLELNLPINVFLIVAVVLCSTLIALVPVTIAGIGTRESFIMFYFMRKHIDKEIALAFCSMFLLMYLVNIVGILLFNVASHNRD